MSCKVLHQRGWFVSCTGGVLHAFAQGGSACAKPGATSNECVWDVWCIGLVYGVGGVGGGAHHIAVLCFWFLIGETFSTGVQGDAGGPSQKQPSQQLPSKQQLRQQKPMPHLQCIFSWNPSLGWTLLMNIIGPFPYH